MGMDDFPQYRQTPDGLPNGYEIDPAVFDQMVFDAQQGWKRPSDTATADDTGISPNQGIVGLSDDEMIREAEGL